MKRRIATYFLAAMAAASCIVPGFTFSAEKGKTETDVAAKYYEFSEKGDYNISLSESMKKMQHSAIGKLTVSGKFKEGEKYGMPAYTVSDGELLSLKFIYDDTLKNAPDSDWHIKKDSGNKVNGVELEEDIDRGAVILQTSLDRDNWTTIFEQSDITGDVAFNTAECMNDIQLANGCYYRVITAYKSEIETNSKKIFNIKTPMGDKYSIKNAQVYDFYASYENTDKSPVSGEKFYFPAGAKNSQYTVATKKNNYAGSEKIDKKDPHYGWDLGNFCLSGYTSKGDKDDVYLKKVGDKVKLTFKLEQDIKKLNGNSDLVIAEDKKGSDEEFKVPAHNMKHGELIIHHTDSENNTSEVKYSDFLSALSSQNADTSVQLFEEGDYEVHLDYTVTDKKGLDQDTHYQTSFKFKIRNSNTMVYIFDSNTGSELNNGDVTESGFRIDTAKSSYPKLHIRKEVMNNTKNGLTEDTRFNSAVSDGETFEDEGIYTIEAYNRYDETLKPTVKTIYVGNDSVLKAYTKHLSEPDNYTIQEINNLVKEGYSIGDDGDIIAPVTTATTTVTTTNTTTSETTTEITAIETTETITQETSEEITETEEIPTETEQLTTAVSTQEEEEEEKEDKKFKIPVWVIPFAGGILALSIIGAITLLKEGKNSNGNGNDKDKDDNNRG